MEVKCECGTRLDISGMEHPLWCDKGASLERVSESMKHDPERWIESYVERNTQQVRLNVLRRGNGHNPYGFARQH